MGGAQPESPDFTWTEDHLDGVFRGYTYTAKLKLKTDWIWFVRMGYVVDGPALYRHASGHAPVREVAIERAEIALRLLFELVALEDTDLPSKVRN